MDLGISGRLALVVGGSRGLGKKVADSLRAEECRVVTVARSAGTFRHDLMVGVDDFAAKLISSYGYPEIIYYCIGGSYGGITDWKAPSVEWAKVWNFNLGIAIDLNRMLVPKMLENKWGRVVMTSTDGTKCNSGNPPYTSSKFALEGYVKTVSKQWAKDNVILSAVAPGHVYTDGRFMYSQSDEWTREYFDHHAPIRRWAGDDEVAKVATFLCSEHASYMAGAIVRADGGSR